ncbi:LOW QUALITY PROTEIN: hypothetical protein PHMEG_00024945 [Phytophthora megakarya]|uniref:Uncharacterized protein n=1 Tax=Phytophthora megakarya TaxID=4795 RepID=A0A225VD74_9STRA|nr:LOW QUALITY PROTEIN: hypothetical protein PHMEG_00024945 [Phytophthora megakarya]
MVGGELLGRQLLFGGSRPRFRIPSPHTVHARLRVKLRVELRGELLLNGIDGVKPKVTNKCQIKITVGHRPPESVCAPTTEKWCSQTRNEFYSLGVSNARTWGEPSTCPFMRVSGSTRGHQVPTDTDLRIRPRDYGRLGDRWVTPIIFSSKGISVAALVVNISRKPVQVPPNTKVAILTVRDRLPFGD